MQTQTYTEITTPRLYLRTLTEADLAIVRAMAGDEFKTDEEALKWIRWFNNKDTAPMPRCMFYIWLTHTNELIGRAYFHTKPELSNEVEIGYGINEEHRSQGYATEAAKAVARYALECAGHKALSAIVKPENEASRRVIEKIGFRSCGTRVVVDEGENCVFDYFRLYG